MKPNAYIPPSLSRLAILLGTAIALGMTAPRAAAQAVIPSAPKVDLVISNLVDGVFAKHFFAEPLPAPVPGKNASGEDIWTFGPYELETIDFSLSLGAILKPDPSISYSFSVVDLGSPSTFSLTFGVPIVPTGTPNEVEASVSGDLTDATGNGVDLSLILPSLQTASVAPVPYFPLTGMGVDVGPGASYPPGAGSPYAYGPYTAGPQPGPGPGPWTALVVETSFTLSGSGDTFAADGWASINPATAAIPESGTLAAGGSLLMGIAAWTLRRHRRSFGGSR